MKKFKLISIIMAISIILAACGGSSQNMPAPSSSAPVSEEMRADNSMSGSAESPAEMVKNPEEGRKIIVTYNLTLDTKEYNESINKINELLRGNSGYTQSLNESAYGTRYVTMVLKVPKDNAEDFVNGLANTESINIIDRSIDSSDVTSQYTDNELRLKTQREKLERLYALQRDQKDLETLLKLEAEISDTIYEIEKIELDLKNLDSKIDYSTINLTLREISTSTSTTTKLSFIDRISAAIGDSIYNFTYFFENLIIAAIFLFPYIVLLVLIIILVRYIYRKSTKGKIVVKNSTNISDLFKKKDDPENKA